SRKLGSSFYDKDKQKIELKLFVGGQDPKTTGLGPYGNAKQGQALATQSGIDTLILHEVGHAVDRELGIMDANQGKPEFGGWVDYGGAFAKVADDLMDERRKL